MEADPFKDWPNDDLLLETTSQNYFAIRYPQEAPLFDWPEARAAFVAHDSTARSAKAKSRRRGVAAVWLSLVGLGCVATIPLLAEVLKVNNLSAAVAGSQAVIGSIAAIALLAGAVVAYGKLFRDGDKQVWLINRLWSERLRQLHFQIIINNLDLAGQATTDAAALERYKSMRSMILHGFKHEQQSRLVATLERLENDAAEERAWLAPEWEEPGNSPTLTPAVTRVIDMLQRQRFGIQDRFTSLKLRPGWHSPASRSTFVARTSDIFTALLVLVSLASALSYLLGGAITLTQQALATTAGILGTAIAALRVVNDGLQYSADTDRYRWYLAAVQSLQQRILRTTDATQKLYLLREMEHLSYQEMRRFYLSAWKARFIM